MAGEIISRERIEREARDAASRYGDMNAACPYPWGTDAAHAFREVFNAERARLQPRESTVEAA